MKDAAKSNTNDALEALGHLALGSRLKRLGERLQQQTQDVLESHGVTLTAAHFPLLATLKRSGPLSVNMLAERLGIAQPGVTRFLRTLEAERLVETQVDDADRRARSVHLTKAGATLVERAARDIWPEIERAVRAACAAPDGQLLDHLGHLENELERKPLLDRAKPRKRS